MRRRGVREQLRPWTYLERRGGNATTLPSRGPTGAPSEVVDRCDAARDGRAQCASLGSREDNAGAVYVVRLGWRAGVVVENRDICAGFLDPQAQATGEL